MTKQPSLTRKALIAAVASALLVVTCSGSDTAWADNDAGAAASASGTATARMSAEVTAADGALRRTANAPAAAPAVAATIAGSATVAAGVRPTTVPARAPATGPVARATAARSTTKPAASTTSTAKPRSITISRYTNAPGSQAAINQCKLVLWTTRPMWLAAHNYCGYQWLATLPTGTVVTITTGVAAGSYQVTGHLRLSRQSGTLPRLGADLILQTCVGSGTGLTLARRLG